MTYLSIILSGLLSTSTMAQSYNKEPIIIASYDTQFDISHKAIAGRVWANINEIPENNIDDDGNGYIDDIHGWNFGDNNSKLFEMDLNYYNYDHVLYAEYFMRKRSGVATAEELAWMDSNEKTIGSLLRLFITYLHGTSSGSVILRNTKNSQLISLRAAKREDMIYNDIPPQKIPETGTPISDQELQEFKKLYVDEIYNPFQDGVNYAAKNGARVVQFGYMWQLSENDTEDFQKLIFDRYGKFLSKERSEKIAKEFYIDLIKKGKNLFTDHPQILFVLPAGNNKVDLDLMLSFPHNLPGKNKMIVGASIFRDDITPFSSYGKNSVDALIPTMNYYVAVPGDMFMSSSATSVSVVILANLAALIMEENPALTSEEVKRIILSTSILKDSLKGKLIVPGIIYQDRAIEAARNSRYMSVDSAIQRSFTIVRD